ETVAAVNLSSNRIARLKRFELDWQAALAKLDSARFSAVARTDLNTLQSTIADNMKQLDTDVQSIALVMPIVSFARPLIPLLEARWKLEDIDSEKAARIL